MVDHLDQTTVSRHHQERQWTRLFGTVTKFETDRNDRKKTIGSVYYLATVLNKWDVLVGESKMAEQTDSDCMFFSEVRLQDESSVTLVYFTMDMCVLHYCCYLMDRLNSEVRTCTIQGRCGVDPAFAHFHGFSFTMAVMADNMK